MGEKNYWFPARPARHGWRLGWGVPSVWQGWAAYGVFFVLLVGGISGLAPYGQLATFAYLCVVVLLMCAVTVWKGEPL